MNMDILIDEKIQRVALKHIENSSMDPSDWKYTILGSIHTIILEHVKLEKDELPIVSIYISDSNWSVYSTRRIFGIYEGEESQILSSSKILGEYGNAKDKNNESKVATYKLDNEVSKFAYETGKASMAPIHYMKFWNLKYPILNILKG